MAYRADFTLEVAEGTPPEVYEAEMQRTAAYLAPATLYPFIREVVLTTIMRSGLTPFVLPIANFRQMFDPDQIVLPLVVESESEQHYLTRKLGSLRYNTEPPLGPMPSGAFLCCPAGDRYAVGTNRKP